MFVFDRVGDEDSLVTASPDDPHLPPASFNLDVPPMEHDAAAPPIPLPEGAEVPIERARSISLRPAARDAYLLLEDLCLLISGSAEGGPEGEPSFLRWGSLSRTFGLELVESIVSGFGSVVRNVSPPDNAFDCSFQLNCFCATASRAIAGPTSTSVSSPHQVPVLAAFAVFVRNS